MKRKVNIKDVAARAKVHPSTVSRVMNPETRSMVSERVADRVAQIASEMGYARSPLASGLLTGNHDRFLLDFLIDPEGNVTAMHLRGSQLDSAIADLLGTSAN